MAGLGEPERRTAEYYGLSRRVGEGRFLVREGQKGKTAVKVSGKKSKGITMLTIYLKTPEIQNHCVSKHRYFK